VTSTFLLCINVFFSRQKKIIVADFFCRHVALQQTPYNTTQQTQSKQNTIATKQTNTIATTNTKATKQSLQSQTKETSNIKEIANAQPWPL